MRDHSAMCAMEFAAHLAGEEWSDHPECVCPTITRQVISVNDAMSDDTARAALLLPLIPKMLNTRVSKNGAGDAALLKRVFICMDWFIRVRTPAFLRLAGLEKEAISLEQAGQVVDVQTMNTCQELCSAAESAAYSAARSAAWSALEATVKEVQASWAEMIIRMCEVT